MAFPKAVYSTYNIEIRDNLLDETLHIVRRVREAQGYHHFGTFSYRGEKMRLIMGAGVMGNEFSSEDYPPHPRTCKTERAKEYHRNNASQKNQ